MSSHSHNRMLLLKPSMENFVFANRAVHLGSAAVEPAAPPIVENADDVTTRADQSRVRGHVRLTIVFAGRGFVNWNALRSARATWTTLSYSGVDNKGP